MSSARKAILDRLQTELNENLAGTTELGLDFFDNINDFPHTGILRRFEQRKEIGNIGFVPGRGVTLDLEIRELHLTLTSYLKDLDDVLGAGDDHLEAIGRVVHNFYEDYRHDLSMHFASITYQSTTEDFEAPFCITTTDLVIGYEQHG